MAILPLVLLYWFVGGFKASKRTDKKLSQLKSPLFDMSGLKMSYRDILPLRTFDGEHHPHLTRQLHWVHDGDNFATSRFAGKEMMVCISDDEKTFRLTYLDMVHPTKFSTVEEAKGAAPDFAKAVLFYMIKMVGFSEDDKNDPALSRL